MEFIKTIVTEELVTQPLVHLFIYRLFACLLCARTRDTMGSKPCPEKSSKKDKQANRRLYHTDLTGEEKGAVEAPKRHSNPGWAGRRMQDLFTISLSLLPGRDWWGVSHLL